MVRYSYHKYMQHYYRLSRVHKIFITLLTSFYHNDLLWNQVKSVPFIHFTEEIVSLLEIVAENFCSQSSRIQARALESGIWCRLAPKPGSRCLYRWVLRRRMLFTEVTSEGGSTSGDKNNPRIYQSFRRRFQNNKTNKLFSYSYCSPSSRIFLSWNY